MVDFKTEQKILQSLEISPSKTLEGHQNGVDCIRFNPVRTNQLISGSFDHTFRCWDVTTGASVKEVKAHEGGIWAIDFAPDGNNFATASADKTIKLWDSGNFKEVGILKGHTFHVYSVAYSPNGTHVASTAEDGTVKVWDLKKSQVFKSLNPGSKIGLNVQYSQDGKYIFVGNSDANLVVFETGSYTEVAKSEGIPNVRAYSIALDFASRDEKLQKSVFVGYEDHKVRRWKFDNNHLSLEAEFSAHLDHCKHVSLDGTHGYLITCGRDGSAKVWSAKDSKLWANLVGATDATTMSAVVPESRTVAVSSWDQRVRLYQLPEHF